MIYNTDIKIKNYIISVEFDTESEEFFYQIKERKQANAKSESKQKELSGNKQGNEQSGYSGNEQSGKSETNDFLAG